jgi:L-fuconolactonase
VIRIDAHQHYWRLDRGDYAWLSPREVLLYRDFMPSDLSGSLAECEIQATILVQAAATEAETRFLLELGRRTPSIAAVVGWVDFEAPDVQERMRALVREGDGKLKAFRPMVQDIDDPDWLARGSLDAAFDAMLINDLVFEALVTPRHLEVLRRRLHKHRNLKAVLDHAGKPDLAGSGFSGWSVKIGQIARATSVYCKLSGLLTQSAQAVDARALDPFVARIFECFGGDRVIWGSDWPVLTLRAPYRQWLDMSLELVHRHAPQHVDAVFANNAARVYGLETGGFGS